MILIGTLFSSGMVEQPLVKRAKKHKVNSMLKMERI